MVVGPLTSFRRFAPAQVLPQPGWRLLATLALAERERWVLWLPAGFGVGIGLYFALPFEPSGFAAALVALTALICASLAWRSRAVAVRALLAAGAAMLFGFANAQWRETAVAGPVLMRRIGPATLEGQIETVQIHGKNTRIVLGALSSDSFRQTPKRVRVSLRASSTLLIPGNWVRVTAVLMPPPDPAAPGGYDFGRAAFFEGIGGVGFAYGRAEAIAPKAPRDWRMRIATAIAYLRWHMTQRIRAVLPDSTGGIASALITGDRGLISDQDEAALRDAGLAHVLAIAGLHMALVGLGLFWVVRAILAAIPTIALNYPIKKWAALAALGGASFYLIISGAATPATRAYVMLATMLTAILFDRPALSMRSVALASTIILFLRPESLTEPGFQMSFAAVVGLIAVAEWEQMHRRASPPRSFSGVRRYLRGIAMTSLVGSIATAPYAIYHFDRATHYAVLGNLLAMPIMGFLTMPAAAISVMAMPFGLEAWPLRWLGMSIEVMLSVGRFVSGLPGAVSTVPAWPVSVIVLLTFGGLWLGLWRRNWRWFGLMPIVAALIWAYGIRGPDILVARDGMTVAIRGRDGVLRLVRAAHDSYSASQWLKRDGDDRVADDAVARIADGVRCDGYGCVARRYDGALIAIAQRIDALPEDCAAAQIVISALPTRQHCRGPKLVIDKFDVARNGGYAVWFGVPLHVETVAGDRGVRPWSPQYRRINPTKRPWTRTRSAP